MTKQKDDEYKMKPSVYGVGYLGVGNYRAREESKGMTKEYVMWTNMLSRCYGQPYRDNPINSTRYAECTVCDEWHNFQNFAKWCNEQPNFGKPRYALDKDMIDFGNLIYCPEKCCVLPSAVNNIIKMKEFKSHGYLPRGVFKNKANYHSSIGGKTKCSNDIQELRDWYVPRKKASVLAVAEQHKGEIPEIVYNNLLNWAP